MTYERCTGKHELIVLMERGTGDPGVSEVVRWCRNCGASVIDIDVDGRTQPGGEMPMKFPRITSHVKEPS